MFTAAKSSLELHVANSNSSSPTSIILTQRSENFDESQNLSLAELEDGSSADKTPAGTVIYIIASSSSSLVRVLLTNTKQNAEARQESKCGTQNRN